MTDRLLIIVMVVVTFLGIMTYDQSIRRKGGLTPVSRLIDFAGLSRVNDQETSSNIKRHESFQSNLQNNLRRLQEKHKKIEEKRAQLIAHRQSIINDLMAMNNEVQSEADHYIKVIGQEREKLKERFPQLEQLGSDLIGIAQISDDDQRARRLKDIKNQMVDLIHKTVEDPQKNTPYLIDILDKIELIVGNPSSPGNMTEDCVELESCLKQKVADMEGELDQYFDKLTHQPQSDLSQLLELSQALQGEYQKQADTLQSSEQNWEESDEKTYGKMKQLVEELVKVTDNDMRDLMDLYRDLNQEQERLMADLNLHLNTLQETQGRFSQQMKDILKGVQDTSRFDISALLERYNNFDTQSQKLLKESSVNTTDLLQLVIEQTSENEKFIENITFSMNVDLKRMMKDDHYAQEVMDQYKQNNPELKQKIDDVSRQRKAQLDYQRDKQQDIRNQLQTLRSRSKDQGF